MLLDVVVVDVLGRLRVLLGEQIVDQITEVQRIQVLGEQIEHKPIARVHFGDHLLQRLRVDDLTL